MSTKKVPINQLSKEVGSVMTDFFQSFSAELTARVIDKAPVDSGTLRGSITLGKTASSTNSGNVDPNGASTKSEAKNASKHFSLEDRAFITAGTDYAGYVEFGTDKMAPQPYMRTAVVETPLVTNNVAKDL